MFPTMLFVTDYRVTVPIICK